MDFSELELKALQLPKDQRAELLRQLIRSLDDPMRQARDTSEWLAAAEKRARELDSGEVGAVPGAAVMEKARRITGG